MTHWNHSVRSWSLAAPVRTAVFALGVESGVALAYLALTDATVAAASMLALPFVWVTVAIVGVRHAGRPAVGRLPRVVAAGFGIAYALLLAWLAGAIGLSAGMAMGFDVVLLPPGWGPVFRYSGATLSLVLVPYRAIGYASLGYLVSLAVRDIVDSGASAGLGGLVALGSCASCALPLLAAAGSALGSVGLGVMPAVTGGTYLLGTVAYVVAVTLLTVRPTFGR
jgi:hypothetical protein